MKKLCVLIAVCAMSLMAMAQKSELVGTWQQLDANGNPTTQVKVFMPDGKLLGLSESKLLSSVKDNFEHPWQNEVLVSVREKISSGEISGDISDFEEPHFGKGIEISSMGALQTMLGFAIADAWMWWSYENALERGAKGYFVVRGSSYPCDECDSHTGIFYPIGDEENRPQYHAHCCCCIVYSYVDRI